MPCTHEDGGLTTSGRGERGESQERQEGEAVEEGGCGTLSEVYDRDDGVCARLRPGLRSVRRVADDSER